MFEAGAKLYETCTSCHAQFVIGPALQANPAPVIPFPENATGESYQARGGSPKEGRASSAATR